MILFICGRGGSGKDTLMNSFLKSKVGENFKKVVPFTTRPKREGEVDGDDYFFIDLKAFVSLYDSGFFLEIRMYETLHGIWRYGTPKSIDDSRSNYIIVGSRDQYDDIKLNTKMSNVVGVYIEASPKVCLERMLNRLDDGDEEGLVEACRRTVSDYEDFYNPNKHSFDLVLDGTEIPNINVNRLQMFLEKEFGF